MQAATFAPSARSGAPVLPLLLPAETLSSKDRQRTSRLWFSR